MEQELAKILIKMLIVERNDEVREVLDNPQNVIDTKWAINRVWEV